MNDAPDSDTILLAYEVQVEALASLFHARGRLASDPKSRFYGSSSYEIQAHLEWARQELDRWAVLMLVASFEASVRTDALRRIRSKRRDAVRIPLRDLHDAHRDRVRLDDILAAWNASANVSASTKGGIRLLLQHRHWLAHGRHWTNKSGRLPDPKEAHAQIAAYVAEVRAQLGDFARL